MTLPEQSLPEPFDRLAEATQLGCFAADRVAVDFTGTLADRTRVVIARALEALEANGVITLASEEDWPEWFSPTPPYTPFSFPTTKEPHHD